MGRFGVGVAVQCKRSGLILRDAKGSVGHEGAAGYM